MRDAARANDHWSGGMGAAAADKVATALSSKENMVLLARDASEVYEWAKAELWTVQKRHRQLATMGIVQPTTSVKMFHSNVVRGGGLIVLVISYVTMERVVFTNNAVNKASVQDRW